MLAPIPSTSDGGRSWVPQSISAGVGRAQLVDQRHHLEILKQIARTLGISLRTTRRRVAALMAELGADSRFQAGVEAVRRGWL